MTLVFTVCSVILNIRFATEGPKNVIDLGATSVLVAVVEAGSLSAAAKRLGVTRSAVSKRISSLEADLGVRLLDRTTRRLAITDAGAHFYRHALEAVEEMRQAELAVTELVREPRGRLRVISLMSFGRLHLTPLLPAFTRRYPSIEVELVLDDRAGRIIDRDFDVALRAGTVPDGSLFARKLTALHSVICASPAYLSEHGSPQHPNELVTRNCLTYSLSEEPSMWTSRRRGRTYSVSVSGNVQVNNGEALCEIVAGGGGIARLPTFIAAPYIVNGRLVPLLTDFTMVSKDLLVVFRERQYLPRKARLFIDFVVDAFGGELAPWDELVATAIR